MGMSEILCYVPTYSPHNESDTEFPRSYSRLSNEEIQLHRLSGGSSHIVGNALQPVARLKPWVYMDAFDSILNTRPDIKLVVGDGRSTESIREDLKKHNQANNDYVLELYPEKMSQWIIFNDILKKYATEDTKYFVYSSSDVIWCMDWVAEAIKEFERNPKAMILYPCVNNGDMNLPCQVAPGPRNIDAFLPPYQEAAKAPVINAYVMIFRMEFLKFWGGYPTLFRNCYTESFIHHLTTAMGGEQRVLPRGWCFHWGTVDIWQENGSYYHYNEEIALFQDTMNRVKMFDGMGMMTPEFLKKTLWKVT